VRSSLVDGLNDLGSLGRVAGIPCMRSRDRNRGLRPRTLATVAFSNSIPTQDGMLLRLHRQYGVNVISND
jgi:hypothetical protein